MLHKFNNIIPIKKVVSWDTRFLFGIVIRSNLITFQISTSIFHLSVSKFRFYVIEIVYRFSLSLFVKVRPRSICTYGIVCIGSYEFRIIAIAFPMSSICRVRVDKSSGRLCRIPAGPKLVISAINSPKSYVLNLQVPWMFTSPFWDRLYARTCPGIHWWTDLNFPRWRRTVQKFDNFISLRTSTTNNDHFVTGYLKDGTILFFSKYSTLKLRMKKTGRFLVTKGERLIRYF